MKGVDKSNKLSVKRHLDELRGRLVRSVVAIVICTALAFVFHQQILGHFLNVLDKEVDLTYQL